MSEPDEYVLKLPLQDVAMIGTLLGRQPYAEVRDVIARIQIQIDQQQAMHHVLLEQVRKGADDGRTG